MGANFLHDWLVVRFQYDVDYYLAFRVRGCHTNFD